MAIFLNIFLKTFAFAISILSLIFVIFLTLNLFNNENNNGFSFISGEKKSNNTIAIIDLDGLIIERNRDISSLNRAIIAPSQVKNYLEDLDTSSTKVIIFSINSPGGTVSASKNLYEIIKNYKNTHKVEILFHTNELLASGGYWVSMSGDKIFANYGSIIGSIGVKGPDWFYYDTPNSISTGIFGSTIETDEGIKIYSNTAGKSKDILNPFRKPTKQELNHLQQMVESIYEDFVRIVSKERSLETNIIINEIGALIYTTKNAKKLNLIDGETNLDDLIAKILREKEFKDYKIIKTHNLNKSLLREVFTNTNDRLGFYRNNSCFNLRSSISAILNYHSVGC
jgi:protease-4